MVLPGKQRTYRFNWTVPEQWHGETPVDVSIDLGSLTVSTQPGCCELEEVRTQAVDALQLGMSANDLQNSVSVELPLATAKYEGGEGGSGLGRTGDSLTGTVAAALIAAVGAGTAAAAAGRFARGRAEDDSHGKEESR